MLDILQSLREQLENWNFLEKESYEILANLLDREIEKEEKKEENKKDKLEKDGKFINEIIKLLQENQKGLLAREIAESVGVSTQKITYLIKLIENVDRKPDNKVYRYFLISE